MTDKTLDFSSIMVQCGVGKDTPQAVIQNISMLAEFYSAQDLVLIYNHFLQNISNADIVIGVIKLADAYRAKTTLSVLTNLLLTKTNNISELDDLINVRVMCAKAIANYKDSSTVETFLCCMNNKGENYKIRLACADALGRIGDRYAVEPLIDVVKDEEESSVYLKETAAFALGLLGDTSAIDPLVSIMEAKQGWWGKFSFLKEKIVEALGKLNINNAKVLKVLKISLLDSAPMVRINTIEALMNSEFEEAEDLIRKSLRDTDEEVARNALVALYNMIGRNILDEVISLPGYSVFLKTEAQNMIDEYEREENNE